MAFRIESQAEPIPGYRLVSRLGGGGYGDVWKCEAPGGVFKAIKFVFGNLESDNAITADDDSGRAEQELRSLERIKLIRHPFILALDRYEIIDGQLMIVSEMADCSLHDRVRDCNAQGLVGIPRDELLGYMVETAEALDYMTDKHDLLHLDIKPQNLFLMCNHIKIGDFGLVKDVEGLLASVTGGFTTIYAAPESFEGYVSRFSDQYSLAIVYQELLTGKRPYPGTNARQIMLQHIQGKPDLESLPELERPIIAKALSKAPTDRWPNCMAMVKALKNANQVVSQPSRRTESSMQRDMATEPDLMQARVSTDSISLPQFDVDGTFSDHGQITPKANPEIVRGSKNRSSRPIRPLTKTLNPIKDQPSKIDTPVKVDPQYGVLRPTLVIGLGQFGRATLNRIRTELTNRFGETEFPLLRTMAVDIDSTAPSPKLDYTKATEDLLVTALNRPARYIRSRDTLPPVEDWLDTNILYRMPRTLLTNGIRALGRLAFVEHYTSFIARLERELHDLMKPRAMHYACKMTKSTLRSNQPIVYVVANLGGGTGSGMFLDCAYVTRHIMKKLKIESPEVKGIFFIPDATAMESPDLAEANSAAALHELYHFQEAESPFKARYLSTLEPLTETTPPFSQCYFLETPPRPAQGKDLKSDPARPMIIQAAHCLTQMCLSPVGRVAESHLQAVPDQTLYQSLGLKVVASPKQPLLQTASKLVFNQVLEYWAQPLSADQFAGIQQTINDFVVKENYHSDGMLAYLDEFLLTTLGRNPDAFIQELIQPFKRPIRDVLPTALDVQNALQLILDTLGNAKGDDSVSVSMLNPVTYWSRALRDACQQKLRSVKARMKSVILQFLDQPSLRISGAEAAHRYLVHVLDSWITHHTQQAKATQKVFAEAVAHLREDVLEYDRIRNMAKFRWPKMQTPGERLLAVYRSRYEAFINERLVNFYEVIRNICIDLSQDILQCRSRLVELRNSTRGLAAAIEKQETSDPFTNALFLAPGQNDLMQAAMELNQSVTPEEIAQIDVALNAKLTAAFPKLAEVCQSPTEALHPIRDLIQTELAKMLEQRTAIDNAMTLFLNKDAGLPQIMEELYNEAKPPVELEGADDPHELVVALIPNSPDGALLEQKLKQQLPELNVLASPMGDEIILYRALHGFELHELQVFSDAGQQAYQTSLNIEHFTPHSRQDISEWHVTLEEAETTQNQPV